MRTQSTNGQPASRSRLLRCECLEPRLPLALSAELLADINTAAPGVEVLGDMEVVGPAANATGSSSSESLSAPGSQLTIGGINYFVANDGIHGYELWKTDGTQAGTLLVKDINPGPLGSRPQSMANVNGVLFFNALDEKHGEELWKSDGTAAGTMLVSDITPGRPDSAPLELTNVSGTLFFRAHDDVYGLSELWKSDGTAAGTVLVKDILPASISPFGSFPHNLTNVGGALFFSANDGIHGYELWKSDGTAAGTVLIKDITSGPVGFYPSRLNFVGGTLFFSTDHFLPGQSWKSDGTEAGTVRILNDPIFPNGTDSASITNVNGILFFRAGTDLWRSDRTASGTYILKTQALLPLIPVQGTTYFRGLNEGQTELWKTDGTVGGTVRVKSFSAGPTGLGVEQLTNAGGRLFFSAFDPASGEELWTSDGTAAGTIFVRDILPGSQSARPRELRALGSRLIFTADDGIHGREPWVASDVQEPPPEPQPEFDLSQPNRATIVEDPANPGHRVLLVVGGDANDGLVVEPRPGNRQQVRVQTGNRVLGTFPARRFQRIVVFGLEGKDSVLVNVNVAKPTELHGGEGDDAFFGGRGNDIMFGEEGNDCLIGGAGNDYLAGGEGDDLLIGESGNDLLLGGSGNDELFGGFGRDLLIGGAGVDAVFGEADQDILIGGTVADEDGGELNAVALLWTGKRPFGERIRTLAQHLNPNTVSSDEARDRLVGGTGRDWLLDFELEDLLPDFQPNPRSGDRLNGNDSTRPSSR